MTEEEADQIGIKDEPKVSLDEYSRLVSKQLGSVSGKSLTSLTPPAIHRALSGSGSATCEIGPDQGQHFPPRGNDEEEPATAPAEPAQTFLMAKPIFAVQQPSVWRKDVGLPGLRAMDLLPRDVVDAFLVDSNGESHTLPLFMWRANPGVFGFPVAVYVPAPATLVKNL